VASGTCGENVTWTLDDKGTLTITGTGSVDTDPWYNQISKIKRVVIESGVTSINIDGAFAYCDNLTSVSIPASVDSLARNSFASCERLSEVKLERDYPNMDNVFQESPWWTENAPRSGTCLNGLTWKLDNDGTMTISGSGNLTIIENWSVRQPWYALRYKVKKLVITPGVTAIGEMVFYDHINLVSAVLPESVTSIGYSAFENCNKLSSINIPSGVTRIEDRTFSETALSKITIPKGVTYIGIKSFWMCKNLTTIHIPSGASYIGDVAFNNCAKLQSISVDSQNKTYCSTNGVLFTKDKKTLIQYPAGKGGTYRIPNDVTTIKNRAFEGSSSLTSVVCPGNVTQIGAYAFASCLKLSNIYFTGNAPKFPIRKYKEDDVVISDAGSQFEDVKATSYYPEKNGTWTKAVRKNYDGTITWTQAGPISVKSAKIFKTYSAKKQMVKLGASCPLPLTYHSSNKKVTVNKKGVITLPAGFVGSFTVTVSAKPDEYNIQAKKVTITVTPPPITPKATNTKGLKITVSWKKNTAAKGYELRYSTDKKFKKGVKTAKIKKNTTVKYTTPKLKKGKTYYVQMRTCAGKLTSDWSKAVKVTVKK
jgi:hypothetical protein